MFRLNSANTFSDEKTKHPSPFRDEVVGSKRKRYGENGMPEFTNLGVGSDLLALSQLVRGGDPNELANKILTNGSPLEVANLIVLIFVTRNTRGGKGEKKLAYDMFINLWKQYPETSMKLLELFPRFGYWKDLLLLMEMVHDQETAVPASKKEAFFQSCMLLMQEQLRVDLDAESESKSEDTMVEDTEKNKAEDTTVEETEKNKAPSISLLAKWLPRENSKLDKKLGFVRSFSKLLFPELSTTNGDSWESAAMAEYRRTVSRLTALLRLPEVYLAAGREDEINFALLASKATFRLTKTFLNLNESGEVRSDRPQRIALAERFIEHTASKGLNGGQLMPHEIVQKILRNSSLSKAEEAVLQAQWDSMRETVLDQIKGGGGKDFDPTKMVPLSDVSGSMVGVPMDVAIALGILISEITHDAFKGMVMTFESVPRWHFLDSSLNIVQKVRSLRNAPWGGSTTLRKPST